MATFHNFSSHSSGQWGKNPLKSLGILLNEFQGIFDKMNHYGKKRQPLWVITVLTLIVGLVYFFFALPAINPMSPQFYFTIIFMISVFWGLRLLFGRRPKTLLSLKISAIIIFMAIVCPIVGNFLASPIFHAKAYANLINMKIGDFGTEIPKLSLEQIPIVDRDAAQVIGEKQMGSMGELVSQFDIAENYSQINIAGKPIRVSPLQYTDLIKYIGNFRNGIQYAISVDMTSQQGDLIKLPSPIMYSESDYLLRDLDRHLRFKFPFSLLGETNFELDDEGAPFYVTPVLTKRIWLFGGLDAKGAIVTNATSGESIYYKTEDLPAWVDRAYPAEIIIEQLNNYGSYRQGFINSIIGQKNVTTTTEGYNYISLGEDIYLITGVTSVRSDTSNLGFYYVNLRTHEATFYSCPSATETAAQSSASGKVQEKHYDPTFPIILNIQDRPVYFIGLKDQSLTAKMYALVDAEHFTEVVVGNTVKETLTQYLNINPGNTNTLQSNEETVTVKAITPIVTEGNTLFYFTVQENHLIYEADPKDLGPVVAFLKEGDKVKIRRLEGDTLATVLSLELK